jgi:hypothetical protein
VEETLEVLEEFETTLELVELLAELGVEVDVDTEEELVVEITDVVEVVLPARAKYPAATTIMMMITTTPIKATLLTPRFKRLFLEFKINHSRRSFS